MKAKAKFTIKDILNSPAGRLNQHLLEEPEGKAESFKKYRNTPKCVDGIKFPSIKEAKRYKVLKLKLKHGLIGYFELQVPYELNEGGKFSYKYIADFRYVDAETGKLIVEDAKGDRTREYIKKRKLMKKIYNIEILET